MASDWLHWIGERAKSIVAISSVVGLLLSSLWYVFRLEERLRTVEAQVQAIATSPASRAKKPDAQEGSSTVGGVGNSLYAACAELAGRAASQHQIVSPTGTQAARAIEALMEKMGCLIPAPPQPISK